MTLPTFIRFPVLKERGIVDSWAQVNRLQKNFGFPSGRLISPNCRAWTEEEIAAWLAQRPTEKSEQAKARGTEGARVREERRAANVAA
jgi:predicted DNA-binding transcriptional regulator AlpA